MQFTHFLKKLFRYLNIKHIANVCSLLHKKFVKVIIMMLKVSSKLKILSKKTQWDVIWDAFGNNKAFVCIVSYIVGF